MLPFRPLVSAFVLIIALLGIYFSVPSFLEKECKYFPNTKVNFGLDLMGGVSLVLEVEDEAYYKEKLSKASESISGSIKKFAPGILNINTSPEESQIVINSPLNKEAVESIKKSELNRDYDINISDKRVLIKPKQEFKSNIRNKLISQSMLIIRKRIDDSGTKEIELQRQGLNKILLQIPGVYDTAQIKNLIGKTAKLTFHIVDSSVTKEAIRRGNIPLGVKLLEFMDKEKYKGEILPIKSQVLMSGESLIDAQPTKNHMGSYVVQFRLNNEGAKRFAEITEKHKGRALAIVMDKKIVSAPRINEAIPGGSGVISGDFDVKTSNDFAILLRSGALPTHLKITEEKLIGPTLGKASIDSGIKAVAIAGLLVIAILLFAYKGWGALASVALLVNLCMIMSMLALMESTLTLPGIAGIALTLGMAVDANILVFERIKEEYRSGNSVIKSITKGYKNTMPTIIDSNITTIAAAFVLYTFGTASIRGFAITLTIGILCSMFTSISLTKSILYYWSRSFPFKNSKL